MRENATDQRLIRSVTLRKVPTLTRHLQISPTSALTHACDALKTCSPTHSYPHQTLCLYSLSPHVFDSLYLSHSPLVPGISSLNSKRTSLAHSAFLFGFSPLLSLSNSFSLFLLFLLSSFPPFWNHFHSPLYLKVGFTISLAEPTALFFCFSKTRPHRVSVADNFSPPLPPQRLPPAISSHFRCFSWV